MPYGSVSGKLMLEHKFEGLRDVLDKADNF
jgi:hypothetical protein